MTKHPPVKYDGRIGWPSVVEYVICDGPKKGQRLPVPPSYKTHGTTTKAKLKYAQARTRFPLRRTTWLFYIEIHEPEIYAYNNQMGVFYDERHRGKRGVIESWKAKA